MIYWRCSLLLILFALFPVAHTSAQRIESVYTSLEEKSCKTLELSEDGAGYSIQECPGAGGYKLRVIEGDLRQSVEVVNPDGSKHDLDLANTVGGGGFSSVGAKAEWRMKKQSGRQTPIALIIRFNVSTDPSDSTKITSYLTVSKITPQQICLTDAVRPGPDANAEARRLADSATDRPCLKAEGENMTAEAFRLN